MSPCSLLFVALLALFTCKSLSLHHGREHISNITVIGSVFCDICSNNSFSNHSYFLQGARVQVDCDFRTTTSAKEEVSILVERTTDKFGIYRVDIPPVDGFECRVGRVIQSFCRARLIESSSSLCNVPGLISSTEHLAIKFSKPNVCVYNLNALNYRPAKKDSALCGETHKEEQSLSSSALDSSLFFWPPFFPPFAFPWPPFPNLPPFPFPFPFQSPPSFSFPLPPWLPFTQPPSLPFPFFPAPNPPAFPFPFPPSLFPPSPTPPSYSFPLPPLPPLTPIPFPFTPSPPPPSPPSPSFPFPFPPFVPQLPPSPVLTPPSPPPPFSLWDPRTWFRFPPSPPNQP